MKIHYRKSLDHPDKIISDVLYIGVVDGNEPVSVVLKNGKELHIRLDRIEAILDDSCGRQPAETEGMRCDRFFIDDGGQCSAPSCWDVDKRDYRIGVKCGGEKTKCCLSGQCT